jgi:hypothetical protein
MRLIVVTDAEDPYGHLLVYQLAQALAATVVRVPTHQSQVGNAVTGDLVAFSAPEQIDDLLEAVADPLTALVLILLPAEKALMERYVDTVVMNMLARSTCPFLLVRPAVLATAASPLHHLLLPLDSSPDAASMLQALAPLSQQLHAHLDLLCLVDPERQCTGCQTDFGVPRYLDQPQYEWDLWRQQVMHHLTTPPLAGVSAEHMQISLVQGDPHEQVRACAVTHGADAIVLAHDTLDTDAGHTLLHHLAADAPCSLLVIHVACMQGSLHQMGASASRSESVL